PLHVWRPKVFLSVAGFAAADYPADSVQVDLRCDVLKQWLATQEPHCFWMYRDIAKVVDAPECLVTSDRSTEPNILVAHPPIGRQAFHDAVRALGEDEVHALRRVLDDFPSSGTPTEIRLSVRVPCDGAQIHRFAGHLAVVGAAIEEVAQAIGEHPHVLVCVPQFPLPLVRLAPRLGE